MSAITIIIVLLFFFALAFLVLGAAASRYPHSPGRAPFLTNMLGLIIWSMAYGMLIALPSEVATVAAAQVQYVGIVLVPMSWLLFIYEYTRQQYAPPWMWVVLAIQPIINTIIVWVNPGSLFHLSLEATQFGGFTTVRAELGPLFWVHAVYSYIVLLIGTVILLRAFFRSQKLYRQQFGLLLVGSMIPWVGNVVTITMRTRLDFTPILFGVAGLAMAWSLFRHRLFDIMPVARDLIFESMDDVVFVLDDKAQIVDLNPAAERAFGIDSATIIGRGMQDAFPDQRDAMQPFVDVNETHAEVKVRERYFDLRISPVQAGRERKGRLIVLRDITKRKQIEAEREALIKELDAYAHTVAHDLKDPLSVIEGYARLFDDFDDLPPRLVRATDAITRNSARLSTIIDDLLLLARVRSEAQIAKEPLDMARIVKHALDRVQSMSAERGAKVSLPEEWPTALGHAGWVEEVWANYLSNAIKYGGEPPNIEVGADAPADGKVRFWVKDNGDGLTPQEQARLFVAFSRVGEARAEGQGLGLSIVERIITRLDGEVGVESEPGKGSLFTFTLPAEPSESAAD